MIDLVHYQNILIELVYLYTSGYIDFPATASCTQRFTYVFVKLSIITGNGGFFLKLHYHERFELYHKLKNVEML